MGQGAYPPTNRAHYKEQENMKDLNQTKPITWGVLGCANIADKAVIPGILEASNATLYGIASRNTHKLQDFAKRHNPTKSYGTYEELLEDPAIQAVYIPLPNGLHYQWTLKALEKGKHVLCEKPLGVTPEEVEKLFTLAKHHGVHLMEAFAYRHSPLVSQIKELCTSGTLGKLTYIDSHFSFRLEDLENVRLSPDLAGGATYDIGCYNLSIIRHLAGEEPSTIQAVGDIGNQSKVDETSIANLVFPSGLKATSFCSFRAPFRSEFTVMGTKGVLRVPVGFNSKGTLKITLHLGAKSEEVKEITLEAPDNYMLEVEQFGRVITEDELPVVDETESLGNARVIDDILKQIGYPGR